MKPIKKKTAKLFIVLIAICAVVGSIFTFVPMNFGATRFNSVFGSLSYSPELASGVYAEYDLNGDYSNIKINSSIETIKKVLEDEGYPGANVFAVGEKKVRIEIGYNKNGESLKESYTLLNAIGIGVFELRSSSSEDDTYIIGNKHIKSVEISTYNSAIYVVLNFNKAGEEAYHELLDASDTIYVCMGGETMTSFDSSNITASESMPLSFTDYNSAQDFAMKVKLGSMPIELNSDTVTINTMSSIFGYGDLTANPQNANVNFTKLIGYISIVLVIILGLVYLIVKYGVLGAFEALAILFDAIIAVVLLWAFEWVELSLSSLIAINMGFVLLFGTTFVFASNFEEEFKQGKTIMASFEGAFKKSLKGILSAGIALTVIFGVVAIVASQELKVFGLITCVFSCLSLFSTLIMLPGFIKIFEAFNDGATKAYRLSSREDETNE